MALAEVLCTLFPSPFPVNRLRNGRSCSSLTGTILLGLPRCTGPGIARIYGSIVTLSGTTIEEVEQYHRDTLHLAVAETNRQHREWRHNQEQLRAGSRPCVKSTANVSRTSQSVSSSTKARTAKKCVKRRGRIKTTGTCERRFDGAGHVFAIGTLALTPDRTPRKRAFSCPD